MQRVAIVGPSGAGKTTLANELAPLIGAELINLDALFHQADWIPTPTPEFRTRVIEATEPDRWVVDGNYSQVLDIVHGRADTIIWLDLPRSLVTWRVAKRSLRRVATREELWNGNREDWRKLLSRSEERNPVLWTWNHHDRTTLRYEGFAAGKFWEHADVRRFRSPIDVRRFLSRCGNPPDDS